MVRHNKPNVSAHALGHIQSSRSDTQSTKLPQIADDNFGSKPTGSAVTRSAYQSAAASPPTPAVFPDDEFLPVFLSIYNEVEHPSIKLLATIHPSSKFHDAALFSDLVGRFPVIAFDGSQYITISQYKAYIHAELFPSRTEASLGAAFVRTYQFFKDLGHQMQFQVLDNESPVSLLRFFQHQHVKVQHVH
jgi:hypothetical protein